MSVEERLVQLGLKLPPPPQPAGSYVPGVQVDSLLFLAGHLPPASQVTAIQGKVGREVTVEQAQEAARGAVLNALASATSLLGSLERVARVVRMTAYVNASPDLTSMTPVSNAASEVLIQLWGEKGRHARTTVGVASLPLNAPVEIELVLEVR
ncbi:MAG: RidA family protein [Chloroflexi bacterium]|nr:RidA family protein [Chloroflexota bacterium]